MNQIIVFSMLAIAASAREIQVTFGINATVSRGSHCVEPCNSNQVTNLDISPQPSQPSHPTQPGHPTQPADPSQSGQPYHPAQSHQPAQPHHSSHPFQMSLPPQPSHHVQSANPSHVTHTFQTTEYCPSGYYNPYCMGAQTRHSYSVHTIQTNYMQSYCQKGIYCIPLDQYSNAPQSSHITSSDGPVVPIHMTQYCPSGYYNPHCTLPTHRNIIPTYCQQTSFCVPLPQKPSPPGHHQMANVSPDCVSNKNYHQTNHISITNNHCPPGYDNLPGSQKTTLGRRNIPGHQTYSWRTLGRTSSDTTSPNEDIAWRTLNHTSSDTTKSVDEQISEKDVSHTSSDNE